MSRFPCAGSIGSRDAEPGSNAPANSAHQLAHLVCAVLIPVLLAGCSSPAAIPADAGATADGNTRGCRDDEYSASYERIGVLHSTDHGATWSFLGDACFHAPTLVPVDPSPLAVEGSGIALYFLDLATLGKGNSSRVIYRAMTPDGVEFDKPVPAYFLDNEDMTDPYVLRMPDATHRMYMMRFGAPDGGVAGIGSALSSDGRMFTTEPGLRTQEGGVPGATLLPDNRVRMFVAGPDGIESLVSPDGLTFTKDSGVRIPPSGVRSTDPHPIRLRAGGYLMVYAVYPVGDFANDIERIAAIEIHLASSTDATTWITNPTPIGHGGVAALVEAADGTLFVYFVDFSYLFKNQAAHSHYATPGSLARARLPRRRSRDVRWRP